MEVENVTTHCRLAVVQVGHFDDIIPVWPADRSSLFPTQRSLGTTTEFHWTAVLAASSHRCVPSDRRLAQQLGLTHTTARGLRAWQLAEEFRLALERQAEEHHRLEEEKKRESRNLPSQAEKRREWRKRRQRP